MPMYRHLEQLPHQEDAIMAIIKALRIGDDETPLDYASSDPNLRYVYTNPVLKRMRGIDVKMETGTGKTYVYTRLMHELYREFGINKFIIMTPGLPIKEGTKSFILSDYARQHFSELFPGQKINLGVVNAGDFNTSRGKRKTFAGALAEYCEASRNNKGHVNVVLLNDAMLGSKSMTRDDYDQTLIGSTSCPMEALSLTRPVVIIDEPHKFKKDGSAWANIQKLNPQLIIRFGATFPDIKVGREIKKDYDNLVYDLNAVESFNQGLVKAVDINYPELPENVARVRYRVKSATNKELTLVRDNREYVVRIGEDLSAVDVGFDGDTTYEGKKLSNDLELRPGMSLIPGVFANTYQELMLRQAIDAHFEKERELFYRPGNAPRVKTISLFFIDSIASYRESDGWLKKTFERLLDEKLDVLIAEETGEYRKFLSATKLSLNSEAQNVHAGYFAEDTGKKGDEAIQAEVDDILRNKEKMLQFKDARGNWNTRRFLFSKWTLREGWDNPNVFVLTKLRSSGSENSKIQEVGRGLRLPVDELGNRLSNEEFRLHFLIDFSEADFAHRLIEEVNNDGGLLRSGKITESILQSLVDVGYADTTSKAKGRLLLDDIIDSVDTVLRPEKLEELIPLGVYRSKIREKTSGRPMVTLRKDNWKKIQGLWGEVSKRFMLQYDKLTDVEIDELVSVVFTPSIFADSKGRIKRYSTTLDEETGTIKLESRDMQLAQDFGRMAYGEFVERVCKMTNLPADKVHTGTVAALLGIDHPEKKFNVNTLANIKSAFEVKFIELFAQRYVYDPLDYKAAVSIYRDGELVDSINQGDVGTQLANDVSLPGNYLYNEAAFDSDIEHEVLKQQVPEKVIVFGKLPRRSIKVPTYIGGTSSPDFVYAVRSKSGDMKIHVLIETKGKDEKADQLSEKVALAAQTKLSALWKDAELKIVRDASQVIGILKDLAE